MSFTKFMEIFLIISSSTFCLSVVFCFHSRTPKDPRYTICYCPTNPQRFVQISLFFFSVTQIVYFLLIYISSSSLTLPSVISIVLLNPSNFRYCSFQFQEVHLVTFYILYFSFKNLIFSFTSSMFIFTSWNIVKISALKSVVVVDTSNIQVIQGLLSHDFCFS